LAKLRLWKAGNSEATGEVGTKAAFGDPPGSRIFFGLKLFAAIQS